MLLDEYTLGFRLARVGGQIHNEENHTGGQGVVPFATSWPISTIRPNCSSRFIDWCELSPICQTSPTRLRVRYDY